MALKLLTRMAKALSTLTFCLFHVLFGRSTLPVITRWHKQNMNSQSTRAILSLLSYNVYICFRSETLILKHILDRSLLLNSYSLKDRDVPSRILVAKRLQCRHWKQMCYLLFPFSRISLLSLCLEHQRYLIRVKYSYWTQGNKRKQYEKVKDPL